MTTYSNQVPASPKGLASTTRWMRLWIAATALLVLAAVATASLPLALAALLLSSGYLLARQLESWRALLAGLVILIFLIPIKRYRFGVDLPFDLEPYRIVVMGLALVWLGALLVDHRVRLRRTALDVPLIAFFLAMLASVSVNVSVIKKLGVETDVIKSVMFFASFIVVYLIAVSVIRSRADIEFVIRVLVLSGAVVAVFGIIEFRTEVNYFNRLSEVIPILEFRGELEEIGITRSDRLRVYASAQHPIAVAAAFAMLLPLALYLAQTTRRHMWWLCAFVLGLGVMATISRTGIVMVIVAAVTLLALRPVETKRVMPLAVPAVVITFLVLPNALGSLRSAFFPKGGLLAEQTEVVRGNPGANDRLADIGPSLRQWQDRPAFGQGYGTRIVQGPRQNAFILDNQWVAFLVEIGAVGTGLLLWVFVRAVRRLGRIARGDPSSLGLLSGSIAASIASFAVGLFFFDGFSFVQVTFVCFLVLALAASTLAISDEASPKRESKLARRRGLRDDLLARVRTYSAGT